ncbi:MAG TPA: hypothetical protein VK419_07860 [Bryobacteraceae bacterium]|nr:hypothetical protein [Bryobacteraceae bacterium]
MPYCVQCGNQVASADQFCAKCGARQDQSSGARPAGGSPPIPDLTGGISNRNAALLCYIPMVGWIASIVVLASERFRRETQVRFHAFQGLYLFVAWLLIEWVISPALYITDWGAGFPLHRLFTSGLQLVIFAAWIVMIIKVSHDENYKLPIVGELAERSVSEQRT